MMTKNRIVLKQIKVEAPFDMPDINVPDFSGFTKMSMPNLVRSPERRKKNSQAIERAIDEANRNGEASLLSRKENG